MSDSFAIPWTVVRQAPHKSLVILIRVLQSDSGLEWESESFTSEILLSRQIGVSLTLSI